MPQEILTNALGKPDLMLWDNVKKSRGRGPHNKMLWKNLTKHKGET